MDASDIYRSRHAMERSKFKGTYRIESARWSGHDYRAPGWYHVVICTRERACTLGTVGNGRVGLSRAGCIAAQEWQKTPRVRPSVHLGAWMVMPNHVHGIIGITSERSGHDADADRGADATIETLRRNVSTTKDDDKNERMSDISPDPGSLSAIVRAYKSACTKRIRRGVRSDFAWQARFYDRVIRNERERQATRRYVLENPLKWAQDRNHPANQ